MTKGAAIAIIRDIYTDDVDPEDKLMAINEVVDLETHNSIKKQELILALKWVLEEYL